MIEQACSVGSGGWGGDTLTDDVRKLFKRTSALEWRAHIEVIVAKLTWKTG
jgi:hypothetical protein